MSLLYKLLFLASIPSLTRESGADVCNKHCAVCDDGRCRECRYGWFGHNCNSECQNCWITGCHKHSGKCDQCKPGRYEEHCGSLCPHNCRHDKNGDLYCRREDGKCLDGCMDGWWGDTCNLPCSKHCQGGSCLQNNGHCINDCELGWWGGACNTTCSKGCLDGKCQYFSGTCIYGCKRGLSGDYCNTSTSLINNCLDSHFILNDKSYHCTNGCKPGFTSPSCNEKCGDRCLECHQMTKACVKCSSFCYGDNCQNECNQTCKDSECDMNGMCKNGCIDGFRGGKCDEACPLHCEICDQHNGFCTKCETGWTAEGASCDRQVPGVNQYTQDSGQSGCRCDHRWLLVVLLVHVLSSLRKYTDRETSC